MQLKKGFRLRTVCGVNVVVAEGLENINFNKMLSLNGSATFLWEEFYGKDFEVKDLAEALVGKYEIDIETATKDSAALVEAWRNAGVLD